ncbi:SRPBCC family protein [Microbacterium keratanolyticum]
MSKPARMVATSHQLSLAAMEEASRTGERTADLEHLLMALSLSEQPAGQVLRGLGVSLTALREAVAHQREAELGLLGVEIMNAAQQRIVFHETGGYEWSDRAMRVLDKVSVGDGGPSAVLLALLEEPSGRVEQVLARLGVTPEQVGDRLADAAGVVPDQARFTRTDRAITRTSQAFIPAPVAEVWALVADPARLPEWDLNVAEVEPAEGGPWVARTRTRTPDGKEVRLGQGLEYQRVELLAQKDSSRVEWRFRYPERPDLNTRLVALALEPAAGGTQLKISFAWELTGQRPRRPLRMVTGWIMRPAMRFALWMQAAQVASSISRVFR